MSGRRLALYFAWSRPDEITAPLERLEDRFPALFETRRIFWPRFERLADPDRYDQGIDGFLDHIQRANFEHFAERATAWSGNPVRVTERRRNVKLQLLDTMFLRDLDTLIIISFDSARTLQSASDAEIAAVRTFLNNAGHTLFVCPHHDIGGGAAQNADERLAHQEIEFRHHGDPGIPARQRFGDFGVSLLEGLGLPIRNRFGLRPARLSDGAPAPLKIATDLDRAKFLSGVSAFNLHAHLPHLERTGPSLEKLDVLARQAVDPNAPPHPFTADGRWEFDALLQSKPDVFPGRVLVCDTTLWSSTAGNVEGLESFWRNVANEAAPE
ncbi:MAG: hypothetical protein ABUS48_02110 [Pseudomonadota bacterium]